ncbi:MAG TPA: hypothetical protein VIQ05_20085, partial [Tardiphaga sp.]
MSDTDAWAVAVEHARWFAALSGPFDPKDALTVSVQSDISETKEAAAINVASQLSLNCDTALAESDSHWLMRGADRRWVIGDLRKENRLDEAIAWRNAQQPLDAPAQDVIAALRGTGDLSVAALETRLAAVDDSSGDRGAFERLVRALEWAGPDAPAYGLLEKLRAVINRADDRRRGDTLLAHGFHGRDEQRQLLQDWLAAPL